MLVAAAVSLLRMNKSKQHTHYIRNIRTYVCARLSVCLYMSRVDWCLCVSAQVRMLMCVHIRTCMYSVHVYVCTYMHILADC